MTQKLNSLLQIAARLLVWCAVLAVPYALWDLTGDYVVSICGPGARHGGGCSAPGVGHYYDLLSTT